MFKRIFKAIWPQKPIIKESEIKRELIYDESETGKMELRYCSHNLVKAGYWGVWWHFSGYKRIIASLDFAEILEAVWTFIQLAILIPILPFAPFIRAYIIRQDAIRDFNIQTVGRACRDMWAYDACIRGEILDTVKWSFNPYDHILYKSGDPDLPSAITDVHGEMVLSMCRVCGKGEIQLDEPCGD